MSKKNEKEIAVNLIEDEIITPSESTDEVLEVSPAETLEAAILKVEEKYVVPKADAAKVIPGISTEERVKAPIIIKSANANEPTRIRALRTITDIRALPKLNKWYWIDSVGKTFKEGETYVVPKSVADVLDGCGVALKLD